MLTATAIATTTISSSIISSMPPPTEMPTIAEVDRLRLLTAETSGPPANINMSTGYVSTYIAFCNNNCIEWTAKSNKKRPFNRLKSIIVSLILKDLFCQEVPLFLRTIILVCGTT